MDSDTDSDRPVDYCVSETGYEGKLVVGLTNDFRRPGFTDDGEQG